MTDFIVTDDDAVAIAHTIAAVGRTGATSIEIGHVHDDPPSGWWAAAHYRGARVTCGDQPDPVRAVLGLYGMLAAGGECATCRRTIALRIEDRIVDGARMRGGQYETHTANRSRKVYCVRRLDQDGWTGCGDPT